MLKKLLPIFVLAMLSVPYSNAANFTIDGKEYDYDLLESKEIGPGVRYNRIRIPGFPLNVNYMVVDLNNPYNRIETQQAGERLGSTERLADAYARQQSDGKKPLGGQNGNFWVVSGQGVPSQFALGATYNANLKNGQIITETNCYSDQWDGGPQRTGVVGIDVDKKLWIESMSWKGYVSSGRWGAGQKHEIIQVNKYCRASGEITLYNSFYGRDKKFQTIEAAADNQSATLVDNLACEVYLGLNEGQQWGVAKDFTATVKEVKSGGEAGTLGDYDLCLVGTASYRTALEQLQAGDVVTINYGWQSYANGEIPELENAIGGNAIVMLDGELTGRNDDEQYNSQVYSRSAYGMSEDGKTLYMLVIDKSTDPVYGISAGCNTSVMCQIMKQLGAWTVCNVDAGGSAQLMVQGDVVNTTTEGTPRAVANGWMVYSTAPETAESDVVSRIEFLDPELNVPVYTTYTPVVLGYNVYGELIDENVEGVELSLDNGALGEIVGNSLQAGGEVATGNLTATYGNVKVTKPINVVNSEIAIRLPSILIDGRDYKIEIVAKQGFDEYVCDPARLDWTVDDESVAVITGGVLKGLKNGVTKIYGRLGDFEVSANVTVEIPEADVMPVYRLFPADWDLKQLGGTDLQISEYGSGMKFTYTGNGSSRGAYLSANSQVKVYGLPEKLRIRINPGDATVKKVAISIANALGSRNPSLAFINKELQKNEVSDIELSLDGWMDTDDIGCYPLTIYSLRLDMGVSEKGTHYEILVPGFEAVYGEDAGIASAVVGKEILVYPNPVNSGRFTVNVPENSGWCSVSLFNSAGMMVQSGIYEGYSFSVAAGDLQSGLYYVRVQTDNDIYVSKIIIN